MLCFDKEPTGQSSCCNFPAAHVSASYSSKEKDVLEQGYATLLCQSFHHAWYQLPQRSENRKWINILASCSKKVFQITSKNFLEADA